MIKFTDNGYTVHRPMVDEPLEDDEFEDFSGRIPFIYHPHTRNVYMGAPNWFHHNVQSAHGLDYSNPEVRGYLGTNDKWGRGIQWYGKPADHQEVSNAIQQAGYEVQDSEAPPQIDYDDLWEDD